MVINNTHTRARSRTLTKAQVESNIVNTTTTKTTNKILFKKKEKERIEIIA